jgi:hypothetical protein
MIVYHLTFAANAILTDGFRDAGGGYLTANVHRGVWVSDVPLDVNEGVVGDRLLAVDVPETVIAAFEWVEDDKNAPRMARPRRGT